MVTVHPEEKEAFLEMCGVYIQLANTIERLDALGHEIAWLKTEMGVATNEMESVKRQYVRRREEIKSGQGDRCEQVS